MGRIMIDKGLIYEKYITTQMHESDLIVQLDLMQEKTVKGDGVIYTPWSIVQEMIEIARPSPDMSIIEPSCGHGIFLVGLLYYMSERYDLVGQELYDWFKQKVVAIEISECSVFEVKEILSAYFLKHYNLLVDAGGFTNIYCHDGLTFGNGDIHFNLCIGNPPYIRAKNMGSEYLQFLKQSYVSCKRGIVDIYFAFIERYLSIADNVVFITPNSFLKSKSGVTVRQLLRDRLALLVDFKERRVFRDASVYTCVFKAVATGGGVEILYGNDFDGLVKCDMADIFNEFDATGGLFNSVLSGIATLCDSVYLVKKRVDGKYYASYGGVDYEIEKEMVMPYLKLTRIKSNNDLLSVDYMIYPYGGDKVIMSQDHISSEYPLAFRYLLAVRDRLAQRDKGKTQKYESWYSYGRRQGLHKIGSKSVVIVPQMIGLGCRPQRIDISGLLSEFGQIVFTSGFMIEQSQENMKACEYLLGEEFIKFAKKHGKPWPGKGQAYYSLTSRQIKGFKVDATV